MSIDFAPPSYRAAAGSLALNVSPLGLVELSDEEFEVNGPRLSRYAINWAMFLGHHYAQRREQGEQQVVANYYRTFVDYTTRFSFSKGVHFTVPKKFERVTPEILDRVWQVDNAREPLLMEIGTQGAVSGDAFIKVAYEEPWVDAVGVARPGRVRILPLNASHCLDQDTEILTRRGWLSMDEVRVGDQALSVDPVTDDLVWTDVRDVVKRKLAPGEKAYRWSSERFHAVSTAGHRWLYEGGRGQRSVRTTEDLHGLRTGGGGRLLVAGGTPIHFPTEAKYTDEFVELVGWVVAEGGFEHESAGFVVHQSPVKNPEFTARIDRLHKHYGQTYSYDREVAGTRSWRFAARIGHEIKAVLGDRKAPLPEFLTSLTFAQARLLYETLMDGDGDTRRARGEYLWADEESIRDSFQMLAMMLGKRSAAYSKPRKRTYDDQMTEAGSVTVYQNRTHNLANLEREEIDYDGYVWCPVTDSTTWVARSRGKVFHTGNCFPVWHPHDRQRLLQFKLKYRFWTTSTEGTRQVATYVEIISDETIEEYVNDSLISSRPNPLGVIPIVHVANIAVPGSPWGLSDGNDIISLNRQYNEISTDVSDVIAYHAAPTTVILGAKFQSLERGARSVWGGLPKDAKVFNLESGLSGIQGALEYMALLKRSMHELMCIPETALGNMQPISNTTGVALAIQFQPLMNRNAQKNIQYGLGFEQVNELALRTLALKEPQIFVETVELGDGRVQVVPCDLLDSELYRSTATFPAPLPLDRLVLLNEIQSKISLGLESKRGALRLLGEEFPGEKLDEIRDELLDDVRADGVLSMLRAQVAKQVQDLTGFTVAPDGVATPVQPMVMGDGDVLGDGVGAFGVDAATERELVGEQRVREYLTSAAFGTKVGGGQSGDPILAPGASEPV